MIVLTKLDGNTFHVNPHQIEYIECRPDTTLTMLSGKRLVVKEKLHVVINAILHYRKSIGSYMDGVT